MSGAFTAVVVREGVVLHAAPAGGAADGAPGEVGVRGDEAIRDPSGCREGGGGDGFAVQSAHGVIVSISDNLRACQAAVFCFLGIAVRLVLYQDIGYKKVSGHRLQKFQDIGNTFG